MRTVTATEASRSAVLARVLAPPFRLDNPASQQTRRLGVLATLSWLQTQPGDSWQQRWQASGAEDQGPPLRRRPCRVRKLSRPMTVSMPTPPPVQQMFPTISESPALSLEVLQRGRWAVGNDNLHWPHLIPSFGPTS